MPFGPEEGTVMPATEETIMMREGSPRLEADWRSGANLNRMSASAQSHIILHTATNDTADVDGEE